MYLRSFANKQQPKPDRFISWGLLLVIFFGINTILYLLFPRQETIWNLTEEKSHQLSIQYLQTLVARYPEDANLRIRLTHQQITMGNLEQAQKTLQPFSHIKSDTPIWTRIQWLNYLRLRQQTFALAPKSEARARHDVQLLKLIRRLAKTDLTTKQLNSLATDAVSLNQPKLAYSIYQDMLDGSRDHSEQWYANVAKIAFSIQNYADSAQFYFIAKDKAETLSDKRAYFIKALEALQSGNLLNNIMAVASQHASGLLEDRQTLLFLAKLALSANQPKIAETYVNKMLTLRQ